MKWLKNVSVWAAVLSFTGNLILIYRKDWVALAVFCVCNVLWITHWVRKKEYPALLLSVAFFVQNLWGIYLWLPR